MQTEQLNAVNSVLAVLGSTVAFVGLILIIGSFIVNSSLEHIFGHWQ